MNSDYSLGVESTEVVQMDEEEYFLLSGIWRSDDVKLILDSEARKAEWEMVLNKADHELQEFIERLGIKSNHIVGHVRSERGLAGYFIIGVTDTNQLCIYSEHLASDETPAFPKSRPEEFSSWWRARIFNPNVDWSLYVVNNDGLLESI